MLFSIKSCNTESDVFSQAQKWLLHGGNPRCLDSNPGNKEVFVSVCDSTKDTQRWTFEKFDAERLAKWDQNGADL